MNTALPDFLPSLPNAPAGKHWEYKGVNIPGLVGSPDYPWRACIEDSEPKWWGVPQTSRVSKERMETQYYIQLVDDNAA